MFPRGNCIGKVVKQLNCIVHSVVNNWFVIIEVERRKHKQLELSLESWHRSILGGTSITKEKFLDITISMLVNLNLPGCSFVP